MLKPPDQPETEARRRRFPSSWSAWASKAVRAARFPRADAQADVRGVDMICEMGCFLVGFYEKADILQSWKIQVWTWMTSGSLGFRCSLVQRVESGSILSCLFALFVLPLLCSCLGTLQMYKTAAAQPRRAPAPPGSGPTGLRDNSRGPIALFRNISFSLRVRGTTQVLPSAPVGRGRRAFRANLGLFRSGAAGFSGAHVGPVGPLRPSQPLAGVLQGL